MIVVYLDARTGEDVAVDRAARAVKTTVRALACASRQPAITVRASRPDRRFGARGGDRARLCCGRVRGKIDGAGSCGRHREAGRADTAQQGQVFNRFVGNREVGFIPMDRTEK